MTDESLEAKMMRLEELEHRFAEAVERAKLEAMKELAYGAGHEINNPLANIATRAQTLLQEETDPEKRRKLAAINAQAFRAHEMIADLMLFARPPQLRPEEVDVGNLLTRVANELHSDADAAGVRIVVQAETVRISADPVQLALVIRVLCTNALQAISKGGQIELCVSRLPTGGAKVTVADNGPGIPPDIRPKIFDPFFSGREAGGAPGLGFGLSKAWRLVTLHGGAIDVRETAGGGATFVISLGVSPTSTMAFQGRRE
ncbi:MAG: ATP-binding protein [Pirellulales bacterium]